MLDAKGRRIDKMITNGEERYLWLGRAASSAKYLRVVYTLRQEVRGRTLFRPISAVEMSASEKRRYNRK